MAGLGPITIIGAGKLGIHLIKRCVEMQMDLHQIISRSRGLGSSIATDHSISFSTDIADLRTDTSIVFLTVPDSQIIDVANRVIAQCSNKTWLIHCSGTFDSSSIDWPFVLSFWPMYSFSRKWNVDWAEVPVFGSSEHENGTLILEEIAAALQLHANEISNVQRQQLHLCATISSNLSMALHDISYHICQRYNLPFPAVTKIILSNTDKLNRLTPKEALTGPALRGDIETIQKHIKLMEDENIRSIYVELTKYINDELANLLEAK